jgi:outer membrane protein
MSRTAWFIGVLVLWCGVSAVTVREVHGEELKPAAGDRPELRLTLKDAMDAALDNSSNVKLFRERIAAARAVASTQLGAMLPNVSWPVGIGAAGDESVFHL